MPINSPSSTEKEARITEIVRAISQSAKEDVEISFADESHFSN